ncbi:MAG: FtsH protease activity modulator HflK [Planctomycetota bacterium]
MSQDTQPLVTRQEATALISCAVNFLLTVAKFLLFYFLVKSVSLKAEAWHSLSDIGSSFVVFLALYMGRRKLRAAREKGTPAGEEPELPTPSGLFSGPDESEEAAPPPEEPEEDAEPRRRAKPEDIVAVSIACLFILVAIGIFIEILQPQEVQTDYALAVAAGMLVMAYASYLLYRFEYHVGMESDSPGLIADGYHSKIDMYGSILVAAALVSHPLGLATADRVIAAAICLGILGHAIEVLAMAARHYLGKPVREEEEEPHHSALVDVYALTGKWGERVTTITTRLFARVLFIDREQAGLGRRVTRRVVLIVALAVVLLYGLSGLFVCGPGQVAFVERFGKPISETPYGPGLHYCWPRPIDRVVKVDVGRIRTFHTGEPVPTGEAPILWTNRHYEREYRFLMPGDNFLSTYLAVHFQVSDPYRFVYGCSEPVAVLANACRSKLREMAGTHRFYDLLIDQRARLEKELDEHLDRVLADVGLTVVAVAVRDMHPPIEVAPKFEEVISAMEEKEALIHEAEAEAVGAVPRAEGRAARIVAEAEVTKTDDIQAARGQTRAFRDLQKEYAQAKHITAVRLYLETIESAIRKTPKWVVMGDEDVAPVELWFRRGDGFWRWLIGPSQ